MRWLFVGWDHIIFRYIGEPNTVRNLEHSKITEICRRTCTRQEKTPTDPVFRTLMSLGVPSQNCNVILAFGLERRICETSCIDVVYRDTPFTEELRGNRERATSRLLGKSDTSSRTALFSKRSTRRRQSPALYATALLID